MISEVLLLQHPPTASTGDLFHHSMPVPFPRSHSQSLTVLPPELVQDSPSSNQDHPTVPTHCLCSHCRLMPPCLFLTDLKCCSHLTFLPSLPSFLHQWCQHDARAASAASHLHPTSTLTPAHLTRVTEVAGN